jgi:lycopene cyclase domain-containing protein
MKYLYLILEIGSISIPLIFSVIYNTKPYKNIGLFLMSTTLIATLFIIWDVVFTRMGIWGFSENYTIGIDLVGMPIEEWMFFFTIPYASLFIHFINEKYNFRLALNLEQTKIITWVLIVVSLLVITLNTSKNYTLFSSLSLLLVLILGFVKYPKQLQRFYISFAFILIPFLIVNGILTGSIINEEVVWYNNDENLGIRLLTIPIEDVAYAFSLLFGNLLIYNALENRFNNVPLP